MANRIRSLEDLFKVAVETGEKVEDLEDEILDNCDKIKGLEEKVKRLEYTINRKKLEDGIDDLKTKIKELPRD